MDTLASSPVDQPTAADRSPDYVVSSAGRVRRIGWLDAARGAGIILVVLGHALGGLIDSPVGTGLTGFRRAFFAIYTFHMPLFFVLSGLLVSQRVCRGPIMFLKGLLPGVVWPYFLWSIVQFSVIYALGNLVNRPAGAWLPTILALPWQTVSQFWFLYALFWMHVTAAVLLPRIGRWGLFAIGVILKIMVAAIVVPVTVKLVANNMVWYALGAMLTPAGLGGLFVERSIAVRAAILPLVAAVAIAVTMWGLRWFGADLPLATASSPEIANLAWRLPVLATAILGTGAVVGIASLPVFAGRDGNGGALAVIGQLTMPIFVLHVMFIAGSRIVLIRFAHLTNAGVLLVVLVAAGLMGPLVVERVLRPLRLQRWLGF